MSLILVDGSALFYRAHYAFARRPLTAPSGELTSVVFGFLNSILGLIENQKPDHLAVVFDPKGKNFRHQMFAAYKATRKPMPQELAGQLPRLREMLAAWDIAVLEQGGVEADDVMGSVARQSAGHADQVWLYTGDKDFMQLLDERVSMLKPGRKGEETQPLTAQDVRRQFRLEPRDMIEVFALSGDAADNIPGAPGIGEKTAQKLIREFGTLENLYAKLETSTLTPRLKRVLGENREQVFLSRDLFIIKDDLPLELDWEAMRTRLPDRRPALDLMQELGLRQLVSLTGRLARALPQYAQGEASAEGAAKGSSAGEDAGTEEDRAEQNHAEQNASWADRRRQRGYRILDTAQKLEDWLSDLDPGRPLAVDTETDSLRVDTARLVGVCLAGYDEQGQRLAPAYVPVRWRDAANQNAGNQDAAEGTLFPMSKEEDRLEEVRPILAPVLASRDSLKVGQNLKYDEWILLGAEMPLGGPRFDTMLASYVLDPGRRGHGLDDLVREHLDHRMMGFGELFEKGDRHKDILGVDPDRLALYAAEDADYTLRLFEQLSPRLVDEELDDLFRTLEMPVSAVLLEMERNGIMLDQSFLATLQTRFTEELQGLQQRIHELAGEPFNIQSPKQLAVILFEKLGLKPRKKTATGYSTDVSVLTALADEHELPDLILEYRQVAKLQNTYVEVLPELANPRTGLIHTSYNQAVAATGRLSSSDPNLQNIPIRTPLGRLIRQAFVPRSRDNVFLSADYSQVELRLMAHLAQDPGLMSAFRDGVDVHRRTAALIEGVPEAEVTDGMRSRAKAINFGVIYGMGARALARQIKVSTKEATRFIEAYFETYPGVKTFIEETKEKARHDGFVETLLGRRRLLPDIRSENPPVRAFQERVAVNTPIQGTAADLIKLAMIRVRDALRAADSGALLLLQVHDELVLEVPRDTLPAVRKMVRVGMEGALELSVPLVVDMHTGENWSEAH